MAVRNRGTLGSGDGSSITALLLVVPGIALYVYILYIMISKLVYPASFPPFTSPVHSEDAKAYNIGMN
jgi:hypothetical protein